ncbi:MAG: hypothetical protein JSW73_03605 [Candidatus Woesearchaeota archaeon]|nr:MAG: hypothetical protein JSW73_03605 [Candidatus Woesearchaeota archaeon]
MKLKLILPILIIGLIFISGCTELSRYEKLETDMQCDPETSNPEKPGALDVGCRIACEVKNWEYVGEWECNTETSKVVCSCKPRA